MALLRMSLVFMSVVASVAAGCAAAFPPGLPASDVALRVQGADLVDDAGEVVTLRAVNLGNWLLLEMWMLGNQPLPDQQTFFDVLEARFGEAEAARLVRIYRENWITQRDMDLVAASGFNAVRVPFSHLVLEREPFVFDEEGFELLRSAIDMADAAGLYVILDMHQVPGGQSLDQPSGDVSANALWTDPEAQERLAWLWQNIARRVKNDRNVVAYDLINEPYSSFADDVRPELIGIVDRTIRAIREVDPDRLIYVPGAVQGIRFYGDPAARGWTNTGFTEHFYPGVFDWREATMGAYARFLASELRERAAHARGLGVPYLWGEFNPVFDSSGSHGAVRDAFDTGDDLGISSAVWAYKRLTPGGGISANNWTLAVNEQAFAVTDVRTASKAAIESAFGSLSTMPLAIDEVYRQAMTEAAPARTLPIVAPPPLSPPAADAWTAWTGEDVGAVLSPGGHSVAAGATPIAADHLTMYAGGQDLFGAADSMRLVSRPMPPAFTVSGVFDAFEGGPFAQAGVTIRADAAADSAHLSLIVFPDGRVLVKQRAFDGVSTGQRYLATTGFPVGLGLGRSGGNFQAWITDEDGAWRAVPLSENPAVGTQPLGGFFGVANRDGPLSVMRVDGPRVDEPGTLTVAPLLDGGGNLLTNASFESGGTSPSGWTLDGPQMSRQVGWSPVRDGNALLAFRHWEVTSGAPQSASQVVGGLTPGVAYAFTVYANRDVVSPGGVLADAVELRIEETGALVRRNELARFSVSEIATGSRWSRLQVRFVATRAEHRLVILVRPGTGNREGALKFDGVDLSEDGEFAGAAP
jgi:endoglucanase